MDKSSCNGGKCLPVATESRLFLLVLNNIDGIMYMAFSTSQVMKFRVLTMPKATHNENVKGIFYLFTNTSLASSRGMYK